MSACVLVIGSVNVDLTTRVRRHPVPGETILGSAGGRTPGGKGGNQALAAALQGAPVTFVGCIGSDPDGDLALSQLREAGVNLEGVATCHELTTGLAVITVSEDGENTIVVVPGANSEVSPQQAERAVRATASGDIVLIQGELNRETIEATVRASERLGRRVVLNAAPWGALDNDVLTAADPLVLNQTEAKQAAQALSVIPDDQSPGSLALALHAAGVASVIVTLGADGAVLASAGSISYVPTPRVKAEDTTGAGDAFVGALVAHLLASSSVIESIQHAVRVGAYAVTRQGAQPSYPGRGDSLPSV